MRSISEMRVGFAERVVFGGRIEGFDPGMVWQAS
jgi:hypothetical protein